MAELTFADIIEILVATRDQTANGQGDQHLAFMNYCLANVAKSSGQILQDLWVAFETQERKNGFFVEFGGGDGRWFSNSWFLERELGWGGIIAEPARCWYPMLRHNRACFIDDRCVWTRSGETVTFNQAPIQLHSTIDRYSGGDALAKTREGGELYPVETVSLNDLLTFWRAPRRIDYLSVDTEGSELDILSAFDFAAWDVRLITVEHNHTPRRQPMHDLLASKGFRRKFETLSGVDDWYVRIY